MLTTLDSDRKLLDAVVEETESGAVNTVKYELASVKIQHEEFLQSPIT